MQIATTIPERKHDTPDRFRSVPGLGLRQVKYAVSKDVNHLAGAVYTDGSGLLLRLLAVITGCQSPWLCLGHYAVKANLGRSTRLELVGSTLTIEAKHTCSHCLPYLHQSSSPSVPRATQNFSVSTSTQLASSYQTSPYLVDKSTTPTFCHAACVITFTPPS